MPSRWDSATRGWRRRVFHYPPPTLMSRNFRLPCAIELKPLSLTPLKMRKVEVGQRAFRKCHCAAVRCRRLGRTLDRNSRTSALTVRGRQ